MDYRPSFGSGNQQGSPSQAKPTVLVIEDDENSLFVLRSILGTKGYRVLEASDGKQGLEIAEAEKLDLILLDLQLPRLHGLGVIHRLRENANLESLPIVIMTAWDLEKSRGSAIAAGCDDFLIKPIDIDHLDAVLAQYVPLSGLSWSGF
jgi:two-component system cell cycle response regulator DivK